MLATTSEVRYFLQMPADLSITQLLQTASESVAAANIPDDLRLVAFEKAMEILALQDGVVPLPTGAKVPVPPKNGAGGDASTKTLAKIADALGISMETTELIFDVSDEELRLNIPSAKLPSGKAAGAKSIALLLVAGRNAGGWDTEWTSVAVVRAACEGYGRLDIGNFATHMKAMEDVFSFKGLGKSLELKLRRPGKEQAISEMKRLGGETE